MLPVVVSFASFGYLDLTINLMRNVKDVLQKHQFALFCLDVETFNALQIYSSGRVQLILFERNVSKDLSTYGTPLFNYIMRVKQEVVWEALLRYGFIHFVDSDVVFCKEPTEEYYSAYVDYDIVYQRDAPPPNEPYHPWTCAGNFVLRNTERTLNFLKTLHSYIERFQHMNDQECQREIFNDAKITDIRNFPDAKLTEFPMEEFTCGYCITHSLVDVSKIMVFHANHVEGKAAKIDLLKKVGRWYL
jgi:hypothetical protein